MADQNTIITKIPFIASKLIYNSISFSKHVPNPNSQELLIYDRVKTEELGEYLQTHYRISEKDRYTIMYDGNYQRKYSTMNSTTIFTGYYSN